VLSNNAIPRPRKRVVSPDVKLAEGESDRIIERMLEYLDI
jgi:hypothetical protein